MALVSSMVPDPLKFGRHGKTMRDKPRIRRPKQMNSSITNVSEYCRISTDFSQSSEIKTFKLFVMLTSTVTVLITERRTTGRLVNLAFNWYFY